jgi:hypothetical protein
MSSPLRISSSSQFDLILLLSPSLTGPCIYVLSEQLFSLRVLRFSSEN